MCISCASEYVDWNNKNLGIIYNAPIWQKILFMASNILFFLNGQPSLILIGAISSIFHGYQCINNDRITILLLWFDTIVTTTIATIHIAINHDKISLLWLLCWTPTILLYYFGTSKQGASIYMTMHSLWHILAGILLLLI